MTETLLYTQQRAARVLGVCETVLRRWKKKGLVAPVVIDGIERYTRQELERLVYGNAGKQERSEVHPVAQGGEGSHALARND